MNASPPPGFAEFRADYEQGRGRLLWSRGVADLETPVAAFLKLAHGKPNTFLLESVEGGASRGRYTIIGLDPDLVWRLLPGTSGLCTRAFRSTGKRWSITPVRLLCMKSLASVPVWRLLP